MVKYLFGIKRVYFDYKTKTFIVNVQRIWLPEIYMRRKINGLTVGHTVFLSAYAHPDTLGHELVHVRQYDRFPLIFPAMYLVEFLVNGYSNNKYEVEAYKLTS